MEIIFNKTRSGPVEKNDDRWTMAKSLQAMQNRQNDRDRDRGAHRKEIRERLKTSSL